jgi:hypothetical protein
MDLTHTLFDGKREAAQGKEIEFVFAKRTGFTSARFKVQGRQGREKRHQIKLRIRSEYFKQ